MIDPGDANLIARLATHVGAKTADPFVRDCLSESAALVLDLVRDREVPDVILRRAAVEAGADLFWRRQARNGVSTFESDGALEVVRIGNDPRRSARAILEPWLGVGIA